MSVKLLTEQHLEFLSLKGGCIGTYESTLVKIPHCWKSHAAVYTYFVNLKEKFSHVEAHFDSCLVLFRLNMWNRYLWSLVGSLL